MKVSHAFCIILHMKLFTKETLTHTSLSVESDTGTEGNWRTGEGGERFILFCFCFLVGFFCCCCRCFVFVFFSWMCFTNWILQGRQKPASQRESSEEGRLQVSTLNKRHWQALPPQLEQNTDVSSAQLSSGHRHYTRPGWKWSNALTLLTFAFLLSFFLPKINKYINKL